MKNSRPIYTNMFDCAKLAEHFCEKIASGAGVILGDFGFD